MNPNHDPKSGQFCEGDGSSGPNGAKAEGNQHHDDHKIRTAVHGAPAPVPEGFEAMPGGARYHVTPSGSVLTVNVRPKAGPIQYQPSRQAGIVGVGHGETAHGIAARAAKARRK